MLLSIAVLLTALLVIAGRFYSRDEGGVSRRVIWIATALPAIGMATTAFLGRSADRERIDVQFVGYRIPMQRVQKCGAPARNIAGSGGVWIGGGQRWPYDLRPDVISLPGYRGHLAEVCADPKSDDLVVRQIRPGESWYQLPSGRHWDLQRTNDVDTQLLAIRSAADRIERGCIRWSAAASAVRTVQVSSIIDFAKRERKAAVRAAPSRGLREALLKRFRGWPEDGEVACVDISSGTPAKCASDLLSTKAPVFAWPTERKIEGRWDLLMPEGATWNDCAGGNEVGLDQATPIDPARVSSSTSWSAWKKSAAKVTLRMITRRTVGGVADQSVPISTAAFEPLPLRLGTRHELGFVQLGDDLIVINEDPSVQLRMTDLYGGPALEVKEGEFDLTFSSPPGEELLVVDLSSRADHLAPKTIFERLQARVTIPQQGDELSIMPLGRSAEKRRFNEVFALEGSRDPMPVRPLLLIRRVGPPAMTFVLPLFGALLLISATLLDRSADPLLPTRWLLAPLLLAFLDLRFALSTRWLLNEYSSAEALRNWIVNGAYLLLGVPLVMLTAALLHRAKANVVGAQSAKDLYTLPTSSASSARTTWSSGLKRLAPRFIARLQERDVLPLMQWICVAAASTIVWVFFAGGERPDTMAVFRKLAPTLAVGALAATLGWLAFRLVRWLAELGRTNQNAFGFASSRRSKWARTLAPLGLRALLIGGVFFGLRFLTYFLGAQEQLPGNIRVDVFSLPITAGLLAAFTRPGDSGRAAWERFLSLGVLFLVLFGLVGGAMNDFGLVWVGGMAVVLALPAAMGERYYAYIASVAVLFLIFLSPNILPSPFRDAMRFVMGNQQEIGTEPNVVRFTDHLQVSRDRDYYRLIDANQPDVVTAIPSQIAREVVVERERVLYQSLDGAWREPFRSDPSSRSEWTGAGFLRGRAVVGDPAFTRAARSDYVFPTYLRAELGSLGLLGALALYVAVFVFGALGTVDRMRAGLVALWSVAIAAGSGLFMLGGTTGLFPFSGKWPLLFSFASNSDVALGFALLALAIVEKD